MSNHTPGPWYVIKVRVNGHRRIISEQGTPIAVVSDSLTADARLIATAPEMYELIECLSQSYDYNKSSHDLASTLYDLRCMALRLLTKIEGGGE